MIQIKIVIIILLIILLILAIYAFYKSIQPYKLTRADLNAAIAHCYGNGKCKDCGNLSTSEYNDLLVKYNID